MPEPMMGAEDFSYVLGRMPGAMSFLGVAPPGSDPATNPPLHNPRLMIDETSLGKGVALHCAVAERFLQRGFD
jgi:hippurate hydrolase